MLISTVFVLFALNTFGQAAGQGTAIKLEGLCKNDQSVELRTLKELEELSEELKNFGEQIQCHSDTKNALRMLARIAKDKTPCTQVKADAIVKFTDAYLKNQDTRLPRALYEFAVAYGMRVNGMCKQLMYDAQFVRLDEKLAKKLDKKHTLSDALNPFIGSDGPVGRLLDPILTTGDFILPSDLFGALPELNVTTSIELVDAATSKKLGSVKDICTRHIMPVYERVLMPIATLDRAGYNFKDLKFKLDSKILVGPVWSFTKWAKIVFLCESLRQFEFVGIQSAHILTLDELRETQPDKHTEQPVSPNGRNGRDPALEESRNSRIVRNTKIGDVIISDLDWRLKQAVQSFDPKRNQAKLIQKKILDNAFKILRGKYEKDGDLKYFVKRMKSSMACSSGKCESEENLKKITEELVASVNNNDASLLHRSLRAGKDTVKGAFLLSSFVPLYLVMLVPTAALQLTPGTLEGTKLKNKIYS
jgi:hypothetical protein